MATEPVSGRWRMPLAAVLFVAVLLAACVAPPPAGAPPAATGIAAEPSPSLPVSPTTTLTATAASPTAVGPETSAGAPSGAWRSEDMGGVQVEIAEGGAYTMTFDAGDVYTGTLTVQDGALLMGSANVALHGNLLALEETDATTLLLQEVDADGVVQAAEFPDALTMPAIDASAVTSVTIVDSWTGLSPLAPIEASYHLTASADGLVGLAAFSVAGYRDPITATAAISVPVLVFEEALAELAGTPLEEGPYKPLINHTDDYPTISMTFMASGQAIQFYTQSQGPDHIPWKVVIDGQEFVTYADNPSRAMQILEPYLAPATLASLIEQAQQ